MYHEARAAAKKLKESQEDNKRRAERRAELNNVQAEHPLNMLSLDGRPCKLHRNQEQYAAAEAMEGLIALNGNPDDMIDRFDGRVLLDFVGKEPETRTQERPRNPEERRLDELLAFERYRDAAQLQVLGLSEQRGVALAVKEGVEIRAAQRAAAAASLGVMGSGWIGGGSGAGRGAAAAAAVSTPAGVFSAVGFSYGGGGGGSGAAAAGGSGDGASSSSESESEGGGDDDDEAAAAENDEAELEAEEERLDDAARTFGIGDCSYRLHKASKQEGETLVLQLRPVRSNLSRKKSNQRARRMNGQGLDAPKYVPRTMGGPAPGQAAAASGGGGGGGSGPSDPQANGRDVWPDAGGGSHRRRSSPGDHRSSRHRSRSSSRSRSPRRVVREERPRTEFITEFSAKPAGRAGSAGAAPAADRDAHKRVDGTILEAMPDRPDPAAMGAQANPADWVSSMQGVKPHEWRRSEREKEREKERERDFNQIERDRRRDGGGGGGGSHGGNGDRGRDGGSSHGDRGRDRDRERGGSYGGAAADRDGGSKASVSGRTTSAASSPAVATAAAAAPAPAKETPQERLKRIMQLQLNKQVQKDNVVATVKKVQVEKEKAVRERQAAAPRRSPSPRRGRSRSRSRSPGRYSRQQRSWRSRSR